MIENQHDQTIDEIDFSEEEKNNTESNREEREKSSLYKDIKHSKSLCANGLVDTNKYIYIEQTKSVEQKLLPRIERGEFCILIAPSQSGKTSLVVNSLMPRLKEIGYLPIYVNIRNVVSMCGETTKKGESTTFFTCLLKAINIALKVELYAPTLEDLFSQLYGPFKDEKVVLVKDEIDSIAELERLERARFLASLSAIKQMKMSYSLYSCVAITNWVGEHFGQTIGNSPFNVTNLVYGDYFTREEADLKKN
nr:unnamed protein product [Naegleria fowleri]